MTRVPVRHRTASVFIAALAMAAMAFSTPAAAATPAAASPLLRGCGPPLERIVVDGECLEFHSVWPTFDQCRWRGLHGGYNGEWGKAACADNRADPRFPHRLYVRR